MEQLKLGFYSRTEIAAVLEVNLSDSKHFKRNITNKLLNWGYSFEYSLKGVKITRVPTTPREKLAEIALREFDLDIRVDAYAFSVFIYSFNNYTDFTSMPWGERVKSLEEGFGVFVPERTLKRWCSWLINAGIICRDFNERTKWITYGTEHKREKIDGNPSLEEFAKQYEEDKQELLLRYTNLNIKEKWKKIFFVLWSKYNCFIYSCKGFKMPRFAIGLSETIIYINELVNQIILEEEEESIEIINQQLK